VRVGDGRAEPVVAGPTRVAAVDCGTNTIRLLIADLDPATGGQIDVERELRYVRLGQGVDRTGQLASDAVDRTLAAVDDFAARCRSHGVERIRCGATSAVRDASNAEDFLAAMTERLGTRPQVLEGAEEARLSWLGAMRGLVGFGAGDPHDEPIGAGVPHDETAADPDNSLPAPQLVVDIGGGSTELIIGVGDRVESATSLDIGSVRITERHLIGDSPTLNQAAAAAADVDAALDSLDRAGPTLSRVATVIGVAGSITTIAAQVLLRTGGDPSRVHHARLPIDDVVDTCTALVAASVEERRALPYMPTGRADVIGGGAVILERVLRRLAPTLSLDRLLVSEHDILDGLAWSAVEA
jgi:exopolyphosphatase / guanosine-5'-triphosphate,3'-diphosphate pyrophosphatase